ncbi:hypothetical protein OG890_38785 [Streptomyces anulatus]|uniref:hypothetical protein n=1 Tax=Streptomyces anulatus TaxID=1892 RepID=UPI00225BC6A6|nr:hypothetical protein [Streptomyces anulatus]MCX4489793.1 hypothetical protein [Streptomyces anulatus]MCX4489836.1 hypothetical protein [Streptomyces anulatus]MCX4523684.1 hypothetical protein [Streptomyces anulatus]MCX4523813.1 hypothetical protein [Streptomyces anulatus]MCX4606677.1 hypothetical protein [Streptomyces anulatus]
MTGKKRSLYDLYRAAAAAVREHDATCTTCSPTARCATGRRLFAEFVRLQDDHLTRLRAKKGTP